MPSWTIPIAPAIETRAPERNFRITAGDVVQITITLILSDTDPAIPSGLTLADLTFRLRRRGSRYTVLEKSLDDGIAISDPVASRFIVTLDEDDTTDLCHGIYDWQLRASAASFTAFATGGSMIVDSLVGAR